MSAGGVACHGFKAVSPMRHRPQPEDFVRYMACDTDVRQWILTEYMAERQDEPFEERGRARASILEDLGNLHGVALRTATGGQGMSTREDSCKNLVKSCSIWRTCNLSRRMPGVRKMSDRHFVVCGGRWLQTFCPLCPSRSRKSEIAIFSLQCSRVRTGRTLKYRSCCRLICMSWIQVCRREGLQGHGEECIAPADMLGPGSAGSDDFNANEAEADVGSR